MYGQRTQCSEDFEHLYMANTSEQLQTDVCRKWMLIHLVAKCKAPPSLNKVREAGVRLKKSKAVGVCNIRVELLKVGDKAMTRPHGLQCCLDCSLVVYMVPPNWKIGQVISIWKGIGDHPHCSN